MNIYKRVEDLLKTFPPLRDSDKELILTVWEAEGLTLTPEQRLKFHDVTTPETITRARRDAVKKYPASKKIEDERFRLFNENKDRYSRAPAWFTKQHNYEED